MEQLKLDFSAKAVFTGKKNQRLAVPCSDEYMAILDILVRMTGKNRAQLAHAFILEGMQRALGNVFMVEPYLETKLLDLLERNK